MEYLNNLLKFVIIRCNVNKKDAIELIQASELDYQTEDDYLPIIVYGNLLEINESYETSIRLLIKEVYGIRCTLLMKEIREYAFNKHLLKLDINEKEND
jgi:hypothetical protein